MRFLYTRRGLSVAFATLCLTGSNVAHAQFAANSNAPITGSADNVDYRPDVTVLSGQVDIRQEDVRILSDTMKIYAAEKNSFTVTGNVILLQGSDNVVTGDRLVYNLSSNQATVTGNCRGRRCGDKGRVNILIKNNENGTTG